MNSCRVFVKSSYFLLVVLLGFLIHARPEDGLLYAITDNAPPRSISLELLEQARSYETAGLYKDANQVYRSLSHMEPAYASFCLYGIARNLERMGEPGRAIRWYAKLLSSGSRVESPDFDLRTLMLASLERVYLLGGEHDSAGRYLDRFSRFYPASSYFAALLGLEKGDVKEAAQGALELINADEEPYISLLLQRLTGERAVINYLNRKGINNEALLDISMEKDLYDEALSFSYLLADNGDILGKRALCFFRLKDFEAAAPLFLAYYRETGDPDALIKLAYAAFHQQRYDQARKYLRRYTSHPSMDLAGEASNREAAYMQMQLDIQSRNVEKSLNTVSDFLYTYEGSRYSDILATVAFYNTLQSGFSSRALEYLRNIRSSLHTDYYKAWAAYMLGIYSDNSLLSAAQRLRPGSYYSFRAALQLGKETEKVQDRPLNSIEPLESVADSILYTLCSLGYLGEIEEVLQSGLLLTRKDSRAGYHFLLSKLAYAKGDPYAGITYAEKLLSSLGSPPLLSLPREVLELLYPQIFLDIIDSALKDREADIEPCLVLSVVREESRYNSSARSSKGALGLMQLMPDTASWILRDEISGMQLVEPSVNISAGTAYLDYLYRRFETTEYVVASYNGGPNNVTKWIRSNPERSIERFIEEIPYRETRNFVKRVYTSYQMYRFLYSDGHSPVD